MSPDQYAELIDFLGRKFDRIDQRFDALEGRVGRLESEVRDLRGLGPLIDQNRVRIQLLAEQLRAVDAKVEALRSEMDRRFNEQQEAMKAGFDAVHTRMDRLEAA